MEGITALNILNDVEEARIVQDGTAYIVLPLILTFSCRFKMNDYPFDEHHCPITLFDISSSLDIFPSGFPWDTRFHKEFGVSGIIATKMMNKLRSTTYGLLVYIEQGLDR